MFQLEGRMAQRSSKNMPVTGLNDKKNITLTLVVTLAGSFLPLKIIYAKASQTRDICFPSGFCLSQNPSHWSNALKLV